MPKKDKTYLDNFHTVHCPGLNPTFFPSSCCSDVSNPGAMIYGRNFLPAYLKSCTIGLVREWLAKV